MGKLVVYRGDDTSGSFGRHIQITITTEEGVSLSGCTAIFTVNGVQKSWKNPVSGVPTEIKYTKEETGAMPLGSTYGKIQIADPNGYIRTFDDAIPFAVTNDINQVYPESSMATIVIGGMIKWEDVKAKPACTVQDLPSEFSDDQMRDKMNSILAFLRTTFSSLALLMVFHPCAFGDITIGVVTARKGSLLNSDYIVTNVSLSGKCDVGVDTNIVNDLIAKYDTTNLTDRIDAKQNTLADYTTTNAVRAIIEAEVGGTNTLVHTDADWFITVTNQAERARDRWDNVCHTDSFNEWKVISKPDYMTIVGQPSFSSNEVVGSVWSWNVTAFGESALYVANAGESAESGRFFGRWDDFFAKRSKLSTANQPFVTYDNLPSTNGFVTANVTNDVAVEVRGKLSNFNGRLTVGNIGEYDNRTTLIVKDKDGNNGVIIRSQDAGVRAASIELMANDGGAPSPTITLHDGDGEGRAEITIGDMNVRSTIETKTDTNDVRAIIEAETGGTNTLVHTDADWFITATNQAANARDKWDNVCHTNTFGLWSHPSYVTGQPIYDEGAWLWGADYVAVGGADATTLSFRYDSASGEEAFISMREKHATSGQPFVTYDNVTNQVTKEYVESLLTLTTTGVHGVSIDGTNWLYGLVDLSSLNNTWKKGDEFDTAVTNVVLRDVGGLDDWAVFTDPPGNESKFSVFYSDDYGWRVAEDDVMVYVATGVTNQNAICINYTSEYSNVAVAFRRGLAGCEYVKVDGSSIRRVDGKLELAGANDLSNTNKFLKMDAEGSLKWETATATADVAMSTNSFEKINNEYSIKGISQESSDKYLSNDGNGVVWKTISIPSQFGLTVKGTDGSTATFGDGSKLLRFASGKNSNVQVSVSQIEDDEILVTIGVYYTY